MFKVLRTRSANSARHRHKCLITLRDHLSLRAGLAGCYSFPFKFLFDFSTEVSGTADKEQDIARIKAFCWFKVGKELRHQRLIPYDV